jgi:hypothetical protein
MDVPAIIRAIKDTPMTNDQIRLLWTLLKEKHSTNARVATFTFQPGDKVSFMARGAKQVGTVTKVNTKTVGVRVMPYIDSVRPVEWKVTASALTKEP